MNVYLPHDGVYGTPLNADGSPAAYHAFGSVVVGVVLVTAMVMLTVYWIFRDTRRKYEMAGRREHL